MNTPPVAPRVVAAVSPDLQTRIRAIAPACELRFVASAEALLAEIEDARCGMLIVGVHFDESTALAALERVLARGEAFPVVCVRGRPFSALGKPTLDALRLASRALGVQNFIDLIEYPDDAAGNARVRAMLERLIDRPA
ncbi:MAG TPA: hypothetical protein VFZ54_20580 [Burkholderiales bacterium]